MNLVEKHIISKSHPYYKECDQLCYRSKNIYNSCLYDIRQHYCKTGKYIGFKQLYHTSKLNECSKELAGRCFNQIVKQLDQEYTSFFKLLKLKLSGGYDKPVNLPRYKQIVKGRNKITFDIQAIGKGSVQKNGGYKLSKTNIIVQSQKINIREISIVPRRTHYVILVVYQQDNFEYTPIKDKVAAIDLGLNNLAAVTFNTGDQPLLVDGRRLKSINQYFNKKSSQLKSLKTKTTNKPEKRKLYRRLNTLTDKRNNKVHDYLHKSTRLLVNQLVSKNIETLVIGKNKGMKQDINIGKRNNQNFVGIPIMRWAEILKYKLELYGITVIYQEESYTSKCSFLDKESVKKHDTYKGTRIKRGLFKTLKNVLINADINASYNILVKAEATQVISNVLTSLEYEELEGLSVIPVRLNVPCEQQGSRNRIKFQVELKSEHIEVLSLAKEILV